MPNRDSSPLDVQLKATVLESGRTVDDPWRTEGDVRRGETRTIVAEFLIDQSDFDCDQAVVEVFRPRDAGKVEKRYDRICR